VVPFPEAGVMEASDWVHSVACNQARLAVAPSATWSKLNNIITHYTRNTSRNKFNNFSDNGISFIN
jgi:hypothetical protein